MTHEQRARSTGHPLPPPSNCTGRQFQHQQSVTAARLHPAGYALAATRVFNFFENISLRIGDVKTLIPREFASPVYIPPNRARVSQITSRPQLLDFLPLHATTSSPTPSSQLAIPGRSLASGDGVTPVPPRHDVDFFWHSRVLDHLLLLPARPRVLRRGLRGIYRG